MGVISACSTPQLCDGLIRFCSNSSPSVSEPDHSAEALEARWHQQLAEIPEPDWDALVVSAGLPFYRWA